MRRLAPWQSYLFATAATLAALGLRVAFDGAFRGYPGLLIFMLPILASAHVAGVRGGLMATVLSCLASEYLLWLPLHAHVFDIESYRWLQLFLAIAGAAVSALNEALHRARRRSQESARAREAAQAELRRDSALLASAQRLAGLGIWELEVASNVLKWSEETLRIFGVSAASFGGTLEAFFALVHPDDLQRVKSISFQPRSAGSMAEAEYRIVRPGGEVRVVSERGGITFDERGHAVRKIGVVMDVTERTAILATQRELTDNLEREKARLVAAQSVAKVGSWETDLATGDVSWSEETHRIFETRPGKFSPTHVSFMQRVHPDDRGSVDEAFNRSLTLKSPCQVEHRVVMTDGRIKTVEERWHTSFGEDGVAVRVLGTCQDITERRRSEEELAREHGLLREAEARYRSLFENSNDGIFQNTPDGRLLTVNPAMARMMGFASPEEMVRERTNVEQQSYARPELRGQFRRVLEEEGFINGFEYEVRRRDGTTIWVSENVRVVRGPDGQAVHYEGSMQDITERRLAEDEIARTSQALQRQKTELRVLFDLMPAMIWFKDTEDRIVRVNQRVAQSLGRPIEEIEGRPSMEIYPRDAARYREADREVVRSGEPKLGIIETLVDAAGNEVWVETDKVPYFDEAGNVVGIVVMAQDITERKRAEADLRKTHHQLIEVSRLGGMAEVATDVLHNVGNVLNSVNVSANLVVENVKGSRAARMAEVVTLLREHHADLGSYITTDPMGQHIPELLEDLSQDWVAQQQLLVTELEELRGNVDLIKTIVASQQLRAGASEIVESVAADELVEEAVRVQQAVISEQHVRIVREFETLAPIPVARHKAVQILVSLLRNARQACKGGDPANRCITLRIARLGERAAISVSDNGAGIAQEDLVRIFAPGYSTRREGRGYGLHSGALAATELGGNLSARSDGVGRGATFTLELPMRRAAQAA